MAVKAVVRVAVPAEYLADLITTRDYDLARSFNPTLDGGRDLECRDGRRERVSHVRTKPVLWLKPRDFVLRVPGAADDAEVTRVTVIEVEPQL